MNTYSEERLTQFPCSLNLVLHPWARSSLCTDKYDDSTLPFHLFVNPIADSLFTFFANFLPLLSVEKFLPFNTPYVTD